jgi:hypothetical protein
MKFKKYNSIENSYQQEFIHAIIAQGFENEKFVVQEKVHGANLCFISDGQTILTARRNELIMDNEIFYNSNLVLEKYKSKIFALFHDVSERFHAKSVTIFGKIRDESNYKIFESICERDDL